MGQPYGYEVIVKRKALGCYPSRCRVKSFKKTAHCKVRLKRMKAARVNVNEVLYKVLRVRNHRPGYCTNGRAIDAFDSLDTASKLFATRKNAVVVAGRYSRKSWYKDAAREYDPKLKREVLKLSALREFQQKWGLEDLPNE